MLLEGDRCGWGASGRNGGFAEASLTHGLENGLSRWPDEIDELERIGARELRGHASDARRARGSTPAWEEPGVIDVATRAARGARGSPRRAEPARRHGEEVTLLDREAVRAEVDSPTYLGGLWTRSGGALVDPARLAWGLRDAALADGVRIHEHTPGDAAATRRRRRGARDAARGRRAARRRRVLLATNAYRRSCSSIRRYVVPVYDYVLVTEPLSRPSSGAPSAGSGRQGIADSGNRFHYYRLTPGDEPRSCGAATRRIYHFRNGMRPELEDHAPTFELLASNFAATFPQLEGIRFTHRWAGAIDTCSRFCVTFGTRARRARRVRRRLHRASAWSRAGSARASRSICCTSATPSSRGCEMVRSRPIPFPPEPLRYAAIQADPARTGPRRRARRQARPVAPRRSTGSARASTARPRRLRTH